jgi:hypothetical protein
MSRRKYIIAPIIMLGMLSSASFGAAAEKTLEEGMESTTLGAEGALVTMVSASASSAAPVSATSAVSKLDLDTVVTPIDYENLGAFIQRIADEANVGGDYPKFLEFLNHQLVEFPGMRYGINIALRILDVMSNIIKKERYYPEYTSQLIARMQTTQLRRTFQTLLIEWGHTRTVVEDILKQGHLIEDEELLSAIGTNAERINFYEHCLQGRLYNEDFLPLKRYLDFSERRAFVIEKLASYLSTRWCEDKERQEDFEEVLRVFGVPLVMKALEHARVRAEEILRSYQLRRAEKPLDLQARSDEEFYLEVLPTLQASDRKLTRVTLLTWRRSYKEATHELLHKYIEGLRTRP